MTKRESFNGKYRAGIQRSIPIEQEDWEKLGKMADEQVRSISNLVRYILKGAIKAYEESK